STAVRPQIAHLIEDLELTQCHTHQGLTHFNLLFGNTLLPNYKLLLIQPLTNIDFCLSTYSARVNTRLASIVWSRADR
ncbi:hypothetical protein, partial [Streptococcus massiliensis]|uniref:hypothetical protein n=1 Tax=Streptococcus massiliensis TaxID=313439 RepID=UPI001CC2D4BB